MTPRALRLRHGRGETRLWLGEGALESSRASLGEWARNRRLFVVTDARVRGLYGTVAEECFDTAAEIVVLEVPEGEASKTISHAGRLWREMLAGGGKRDSRLVALGGGSVGDLGGFVAGCFLRGIEHVLLPTTLLAQVDAAIGGKTAVDLPAAKNSVGLFRHPSLVVGDVSWLGSLPRDERAAGLFEVIKTGFLLDPDLFRRVEDDLEAILDARPTAVGPVVARAAAAKLAVVEEDPEESGLRRVLNFGHTLGHALETLAGYRDLRHGEAVGYGMLFAARLGEQELGLPRDDAERLRALIARVGLPDVSFPPVESLLKAMDRDKKAREAGLSWVLPARLGEGRIQTVPRERVRDSLASWLRDPGPGSFSGGR